MKITFEVVETERGQGLTCPYKDCGGKFVMNLSRLDTIESPGALNAVCCPYCARMAHLPEGHRAGDRK